MVTTQTLRYPLRRDDIAWLCWHCHCYCLLPGTGAVTQPSAAQLPVVPKAPVQSRRFDR